MKSATHRYYAEISRDYETTIRQLVPQYDELIGCAVDLLDLVRPQAVLDLGAGIGAVTARILDTYPNARVTAVDASEQAVAQACSRLSSHGSRAQVLHADVVDFAPEAQVDAVLSTLTLHNLAPTPKRRLLGRVHEWLRPDGVFVWGDLIRHSDPALQERLVRYRAEFALAAGCAPHLVEWNFRKEREDDFPLTIEDTLRTARRAGFLDPQVVWAHDTFAAFLLRARPA